MRANRVLAMGVSFFFFWFCLPCCAPVIPHHRHQKNGQFPYGFRFGFVWMRTGNWKLGAWNWGVSHKVCHLFAARLWPLVSRLTWRSFMGIHLVFRSVFRHPFSLFAPPLSSSPVSFYIIIPSVCVCVCVSLWCLCLAIRARTMRRIRNVFIFSKLFNCL